MMMVGKWMISWRRTCDYNSFFAKLERDTISCKAPTRGVSSAPPTKCYPRRTLMEETSLGVRVNKRGRGIKCLGAYPRSYDGETACVGQRPTEELWGTHR